MNHNKKSTFNSHYIQIPHKHEQTMQIGPHGGYDSDKIRRQKHRRHCHTPSHEYHAMQSRYPSIMVVMVTHILAIMVVASVEIQRYLVFILVLLVEQTDTHLGSVHKCNH